MTLGTEAAWGRAKRMGKEADGSGFRGFGIDCKCGAYPGGVNPEPGNAESGTPNPERGCV